MAFKDRVYYVYILTNDSHSVLYTGVINKLLRRLREHKEKVTPGFTEKYKASKLVYLEAFQYVTDDIGKKNKSKKAAAQKKCARRKQNPPWDDLLTRFQ